LLDASAPLGAAEIATQVELSPRQVNYNLKSIKGWLAQQKIAMRVTPGVGVELDCSPEQSASIQQEIFSKSSLQLILSAGQRPQLLALLLLTSSEPVVLLHLQRLLQISRATILKDLDDIQAWLSGWGISLVRRPNFGILALSDELTCQQALAALVWGETPFADPLIHMSHADGLTFTLKADASLLPIVAQANKILDQWNTQRVVGLVTYAEEQLGGRFTDDAVLHLSLTLAILTARVQSGHHIDVDAETLAWLEGLPIWPAARSISKRLGWRPGSKWQDDDIAGVAMQILAAPRNEIWPGDLERDQAHSRLIDRLIEYIGLAYRQPELCEDRTLRDGLVNSVIPACLRQRFGLWFPSSLGSADLPETYGFENKVAGELAGIIKELIQVDLPASEVNNLAMLLHAAAVRSRPSRLRRVLVVCPSGMATAQLLVARLETRFPGFATLKVVSLRELNTADAASADLILTTVPLPKTIGDNYPVIQVHPLLTPQDVDAITRFLR
jgi:mannitol operon transcriptional antiterminator